MVKTGVFADGWLLTTTTLVKVTLPVLRTVPVNVSGCPGATGPAGQALVTWMPGVMEFWQVTVVELVRVRGVAVNSSVARTTRVAVLGTQGFTGR